MRWDGNKGVYVLVAENFIAARSIFWLPKPRLLVEFICGIEDAVCRRNITVAIRRNYLLALNSAIINCLHEYEHF